MLQEHRQCTLGEELFNDEVKLLDISYDPLNFKVTHGRYEGRNTEMYKLKEERTRIMEPTLTMTNKFHTL